MTIKNGKALVKSLGYRLVRVPEFDEFILVTPQGKYFTNDVKDAVSTALWISDQQMIDKASGRIQ